MSFDISALDTLAKSQDGVDMPLIHQGTGKPFLTEDGTPLFIRLRGRTSDEFIAADDSMREQKTALARRGVALTQQDIDNFGTALLVAATAAWNFDKMDGEPFPCTPQNAKRLWSDRRFRWVREQAYGFVVNDGNF